MGYLTGWVDITCSENRTVFQELRSRNLNCKRKCPRRNIRAYLSAKWRLLCLLSFKSFSQHKQFWQLGNILECFPVLARSSLNSSIKFWTGIQHLRHSLSRSKHGLLYFAAFVTDSEKLSHSFLKQCHSQSVAVLELYILDVRLLEGQDALFVLWRGPSAFFVTFSIWSFQSSLSSMVTPSNFAVLTWLT